MFSIVSWRVVVAGARDVVVLHEQHRPGRRGPRRSGRRCCRARERGSHSTRTSPWSAQVREQRRRRARRRACAARGRGRGARGSRSRTPRSSAGSRGARRGASRARAGALAGRDLEHVAVALGVVADHVEHERADDLDLRDVARRAVLGGERERALDRAPGASARAPRQSAGNSSPVRWTSQTSRSSLPARASGRRCSAASSSAVVAEWLSSAPRGRRAQAVAAASPARTRPPCTPCRSDRP